MARSDQRRSLPETHAKLEARVVHVSEATIRKKWRKLPIANHSAVRELMFSAKEQSRSRKGTNGIDNATEGCVNEVVDKLTDKLTRIPYPAGTEEQYFDHEANLHRVNRIEAQLSSNMHAMRLLQAQLAKEEELLKQDEAEVKYLEQSLKSNEAIRRQQSRTLHPMAQKLLAPRANIDLMDLHDAEEKADEPSLEILFEDNDMSPILEQLQNHLDSMHKNSKDIKDVKCLVEETSFDLTTSVCLQQSGSHENHDEVTMFAKQT